MRLNYKCLGDYIQPINKRNVSLEVDTLLGVSIKKVLMPSIANTIGTDMSRYKIIEKNQFAYGPVTSRNGDKISIALLEEHDKALVSQAYTVFEIIDDEALNAEYLMMWFRRPEFDRYARFKSHGSARETFDWEELEDTELPIPSIEKQREIVKEYNSIVNRIKLNETLNQKLEDTAQALYKHWFVDFEFPNANGKPYKSSGGEMVYNDELDIEIPLGWENKSIGNYYPIKSGFAFKSNNWTEQGIPIIKIGSISNNTIDLDSLGYIESVDVKANKSIVSRGDLVVAMTGATIGKIGLVPNLGNIAYINQRVGLFTMKNQQSSEIPFLYISLLKDEIKNEILNVGGDSAQANISNSQIESFKTLFPLKHIFEDFNSITLPLFKLILNNIDSNCLLKELKSILLSKMSKVETKTAVV